MWSYLFKEKNMEEIKSKFSSRKWWACLIGSLLPPILSFVAEDVELAEALKVSGAVLISYIFGQGAVDYAEKKASSGD
tara:strand:+ start:886 stop:1119 length:234 start_codon:yes stop_codon:yes gene_type:complete